MCDTWQSSSRELIRANHPQPCDTLLWMSFSTVVKSLAPTVALEILRAQRELAASSGSSALFSWFSACSPRVRSALERSRFSLLPLSLRSSLCFVIDVGANEGQWLSSLLRLVAVKRVLVFEPNPEAMEKCRSRVGHYPGIDFKEIALGSTPGKAVLHITKASDFSSLLQPKSSVMQANYASGSAEIVAESSVQVMPLDELLHANSHVDLLKIDVQGVERDVLAGARKTLRNTTAVLLEVNFRSHYEGDETFGPLHSLMSDLGFHLWSISPPYRGPSGEALWADALFLNVAMDSLMKQAESEGDQTQNVKLTAP